MVYHTLVSSELVPEVGSGKPDNTFEKLYTLWSVESMQGLKDSLAKTASHSLPKPVCNWLEENRSFLIYGHTLEWWTNTGRSIWDKNKSIQNDHRFFNTIQSRMRLLMTEGGYLGWAHPQTRQGDKIAFLQGCSKPVVLRACEAGYWVIGDACITGKSTSDLVRFMDDSTLESIQIV